MIQELSVIIPTLNEEKYVPQLLNSLCSQTYNGKLQVIVVDGGSRDNTIQVVQIYKSKLKDLLTIRSDKSLPLQRNKGAERAKHKYLLFADADLIFPPEFLERLLKKANANEDFITSVFLWSSEKNIIDQITLCAIIPAVILFSLFDPLVGAGFLFTTQKNHKRLGGFKERVIFGEDNDYGRRSIKNGAKYHLYFFPYALMSPRRAREMGRIKLLLHWFRGYIRIKKKGPIPENSGFDYPYGHYKS